MEHPEEALTPLLRLSGASLLLGGVLMALVNLVLTPRLPSDAGSIAIYTSTAFAWRMPLAALVVALTLLGTIGLYLVHAGRLRFGGLAFLLAGAGGLMTFCAESVQATLIRDLAQAAPETLARIEAAGELGRYDLGFAIAAGTFLLGWLAVGVVTLRAGVLSRRGPTTLLAGMVLVGVLGALAGVTGAAVGNAVLGAGWALLGFDLRRSV